MFFTFARLAECGRNTRFSFSKRCRLTTTAAAEASRLTDNPDTADATANHADAEGGGFRFPDFLVGGAVGGLRFPAPLVEPPDVTAKGVFVPCK